MTGRAGDGEPLGDARPWRVGIVDDHELFADAFAATLTAIADFDVTVVATEPEPVVAAARNGDLDLALVDLRLGAGDDAFATIHTIRELSDREPGGCRVVVVTASADDRAVARAFEAGCHGYLLKLDPIDDVIDRLRRVMAGEFVTSPGITRPRPGTTPLLSDRELDVLERLAAGTPTKQIATELHLSVNTVRNHVNSINRKLETHSRLEAVAAATNLGIIAH